MAKSVQQKTERSPEEVARLRELRERYRRDKPSIADLEAQGAEFATLGEVILLRCLADELRQERERHATADGGRDKRVVRVHGPARGRRC